MQYKLVSVTEDMVLEMLTKQEIMYDYLPHINILKELHLELHKKKALPQFNESHVTFIVKTPE